MVKPESRNIFVGRDIEFSKILQLLEDARSGIGSVVLVAGEPGIGKTTILNEVRKHARANNMVDLVGHCIDEEGIPPYWPWVEAFRGYIEECPADELASQLGGCASLVSSVLPEIRQILADLPPLVEAKSPESSRSQLYDAFTQFIHRAALASPILLTLEDLHWAAIPSLRLVSFIARQIESTPIVIAISYRDSEIYRPLTRFLAEMTGETRVFPMPIKGWILEDTARYLELAGYLDYSEDTISGLHEQTDGAPLFVVELARLLENENPQNMARAIATTGVGDVIGRRLTRLSALCNGMLSVAAIIGRSFSARVLSLEGSLADSDIYDALEEAEKANIIDADEELPGRYTFRHELIRRSILGETTATTRARSHLRIASILEEHYGEGASERASEIARHLVLAGEFADANMLLDYSSRAAENAIAGYSYEEAEEYFGQALKIVGEDVATCKAARLWYGLGRASIHMGDIASHEQALEKAFEICEQLGDKEMAIEIAIGLDHHSIIDRIKRRALEWSIPESTDRATLLAQLALQLTFIRRDIHESDLLLSEAARVADKMRDPRLKAEIGRVKARVEFNQGKWGVAITSAEEAVALANDFGDDHLRAAAYMRTSISYMETEHPRRGIEAGRRAILFGERSGDMWLVWQALLQQCTNLMAFGEFSESRRLSDRLLRMNPDFFLVVAQRAELELLVGDIDAGSRHLEKFLWIVDNDTRIQGGVPHWKAVNTFSLWAFLTDREDLLHKAEESVHSVFEAEHAGPAAWWLASPGLARIAICRGDPATAEKYFEILRKSYGLRYGHEHILGIAADAAGMSSLAEEYFSRGWASCEPGGKVLELVETAYRYSSFLQRRNNNKERNFAGQIIEIALHEARRCGMGLWENQLMAIARINAGAAHDLSPREIEVLTLVVEGLTDKEIGSRLFISPKTAGNHLSHLREKLGCKNRAEMVRFALEKEILDRQLPISYHQ